MKEQESEAGQLKLCQQGALQGQDMKITVNYTSHVLDGI